MSNQWVEVLLRNGDAIEQIGINKFSLGEKFPKYAEFWAKYIYLMQPLKLEAVFKYHYGVYYHLVMALNQNEKVNEFPFLDIGSSFTHLATVVDLVQRLFITALYETQTPLTKALDKQTFEEKVELYWEKSYEKDLKKFKDGFGRPVSIKLHDTESVFQEQVVNAFKKGKNFQIVSNEIRQYRNKLVHDLPPLKLFSENENKVYIPKLLFLEKYRQKSLLYKPTENEKRSEYVLAEAQIIELANRLIVELNHLWEILLALMSKLSLPENEGALTSQWIESLSVLANIPATHASGVIPSDNMTFPQEFAGIRIDAATSDQNLPYLRPTNRISRDNIEGKDKIDDKE